MRSPLRALELGRRWLFPWPPYYFGHVVCPAGVAHVIEPIPRRVVLDGDNAGLAACSAVVPIPVVKAVLLAELVDSVRQEDVGWIAPDEERSVGHCDIRVEP